jgi:hypothetical protein
MPVEFKGGFAESFTCMEDCDFRSVELTFEEIIAERGEGVTFEEAAERAARKKLPKEGTWSVEKATTSVSGTFCCSCGKVQTIHATMERLERAISESDEETFTRSTVVVKTLHTGLKELNWTINRGTGCEHGRKPYICPECSKE